MRASCPVSRRGRTRGDVGLSPVTTSRRPLRGIGHRLTNRTDLLRQGLTPIAGDTAHRVRGCPGTAGAVPLGEALAALRRLGERRWG